MQYHQLRLAMLVKIITSYDAATTFEMALWKGVLDGDKKHSARHVVDAKVEWGQILEHGTPNWENLTGKTV